MKDKLISSQAVLDLWDKYHSSIAINAARYDKELRALPSAFPCPEGFDPANPTEQDKKEIAEALDYIRQTLDLHETHKDAPVAQNLPNACTDVISRQDALNAIRPLQTYKLFEGDDMILVDKAKVQTELMMLPSTEPEQPIGVQDILQYLDEYLHPIVSPEHWSVYSELYDMVSMLTSAEPEIIRCRDCKHYRKTNKECHRTYYRCAVATPDWFCAGAERRTDEREEGEQE